MTTVTVSNKGEVVIPAAIRRRLGIAPGTQLDFELIGDAIQVRQVKRAKPTRPEDGYGMLVCRKPGERRLLDFDVAEAMRQADDDGGHGCP